MITDYQRYRLYEILPGLTIWLSLFLAIILSFVKPLWMIYFIILFDIYWVLKVANYVFYLVIAWNRFRVARQIDWKEKLVQEKINYEDKRHLVFLTVFNEEWSVVKTAVESVCASAYDKEKFTIVIAGEERKKEHCEMIFNKVKEGFSACFGDIVFTLHPTDSSEEVAGKGSNLNYAERKMKKYIDEREWNYKKIIVTVFDIDTVCHKEYFAYLTYLYCTHPNPTRSSYQPIALYNNNMWESQAVLRVMAFGTTFWMMTSLARQDALVTFSSHSMSFQALVDAGFHEKRIVSEDSRIFYQCILAYNGNYEVTPMYIPVSMDTVRDDSWWRSIKNLYRQQRRWAWGAEHIPYLFWEFRKKGKLIPWWKKFKWIFIEWEGKWSWAMVALIITLLGRLPLWVAPESVRQSALFFNAPHILEDLMFLAMFGLLLSALLSLPLLPKKPDSHPTHKYAIMLLQWILLPISMIFVGSVPAIDAVTHLMFGRYLGFNISQKKRVENKK
jgi:hypothetical protein